MASILNVIDKSEALPTSKTPPIYHMALPTVSVCARRGVALAWRPY